MVGPSLLSPFVIYIFLQNPILLLLFLLSPSIPYSSLTQHYSIEMEAAKDQATATNFLGGSLLRYPLRTATKSKDANCNQVPSATRRVRTPLDVSKSMNVINLSGKERSAKPSRRLSNPMKLTNSPYTIPIGNLTPVTDNRKNRLINQMASDSPISDASISSSKRRFCVLSSVSYWLTQIKLSEAASKHSVSLGFFRLAFESGVEPLHRMREELKSYVLKHNLIEELPDATKDILNSYNLLEDFERLHLSESDFQIAEDGLHNPDEIAKYSETNIRSKDLKPNFVSVSTLVESNKKEGVHKKTPAARKKSLSLENPESVENVNDSFDNTAIRTSQKIGKQEKKKGMDKCKYTEKNSSNDEADGLTNKVPKLNAKENMEDMSSSNEVIQAS